MSPEARQPGSEQTRYDVRGGAAWITLDRPEVRNALSRVMVNEIWDHLQRAYDDPEVRCVVFTGAGKGFCSGADLKNPPGEAASGERAVPYTDLMRALHDGPKPVLVAINGAAFAGGLGLVGAADIVIAADDAQFSFSEVRIGVIPAIISVVCLPKLGAHHGMRLFLTGERFDASAAVRYGLVHKAVPRADLEAAIGEEVAALRLAGPNALAECKKLVRQVGRWSFEEGLERTPEWSRSLFGTDEAREGMAAFREKRPPRWAAPGPGSGEEGGGEA